MLRTESSAVNQMHRRLHRPGFCPEQKRFGNALPRHERALRGLVRDVYATRFGDAAAQTIEAKLSERELETLRRALRTRPPGSDPLTMVDYLYLGQLPPLLFANEVWQDVKSRLSDQSGCQAASASCDRPDCTCSKRNRARSRSGAGSSAQGNCRMQRRSGV